MSLKYFVCVHKPAVYVFDVGARIVNLTIQKSINSLPKPRIHQAGADTYTVRAIADFYTARSEASISQDFHLCCKTLCENVVLKRFALQEKAVLCALSHILFISIHVLWML